MAKICIDPGHGGTDCGAAAFGREESADALRLALRVRDILQNNGVEVVLTRETDKNVTISERCKIANNAYCDYFLSIHRNAGGGSGYEAWVLSTATDLTTSKAEKILNAVVDATGSKNRGVKKGAVFYKDFGVNKGTKMASVLLEVGFIDSENDNAEFDKYFDAIAEGISNALMTIVGAKSNVQTTAYLEKPTDYFEKGDRGIGVYTLKQILRVLKSKGRIKSGVNNDDIFGDGTQAAVKEVQRLSGIGQDGKFGVKTADSIYNLFK